MTAPNKRGAPLIQIRTNPQAPIRLMDRPVYRPSSIPKFIGNILVSLLLWGLIWLGLSYFLYG